MEVGGGIFEKHEFFLLRFFHCLNFFRPSAARIFLGLVLAYCIFHLIFTCMYIFFVFPPIVFCMGKLQGKILGAESVMHLNAMRHYNLPLWK